MMWYISYGLIGSAYPKDIVLSKVLLEFTWILYTCTVFLPTKLWELWYITVVFKVKQLQSFWDKGHIEIISINIACNFFTLYRHIVFQFNRSNRKSGDWIFLEPKKELKVQIKLVYLSFE